MSPPVIRTLYRALLRSVRTRQGHLDQLRDEALQAPRALGELALCASAETRARIQGCAVYEDLCSTCKWTRYALHLHDSDPVRACRARFDETAAELALLGDATTGGSLAADADDLERELRNMMEEMDKMGKMGEGLRDKIDMMGNMGESATLEACMPPAMAELLDEMRKEPLTARLDNGFEGLRMLDELNGHVSVVLDELSSGAASVQRGKSAARGADAGESPMRKPPLSKFDTTTDDPYGVFGET